MGCKGIEGSFRTVLPDIDFVNIGLLSPGWCGSRRFAPSAVTCRKRVEVACFTIVATCKGAQHYDKCCNEGEQIFAFLHTRQLLREKVS